MIGLSAVAGIASANIDHSQLINMAAGGTGAIAGQHLSMIESGETTFGYGVQGPASNVMADDFTVGAGGFNVTGLSVFSYVTGATTPGVTGVNWAIGAAPVIQSGLTATALSSTFWTVGGKNVYRVGAGDTGSAGGLREIQISTVTGLNINLSPGTYFLSFSVNPGNFSPPLPTSLATYGLNAQQSVAGGAFAPVLNGSVGADMAFIIQGQPVPEPASVFALCAGVAALAARRRRKKVA